MEESTRAFASAEGEAGLETLSLFSPSETAVEVAE